jgi:adenylyltransferase/sulfurtransferase
MLAAFPGAQVEARIARIDAMNALAHLEGHALVIDGTDGIATKYLLNDAALLAGIPLVFGGVLRFSGQAMVVLAGGPCLRCLYESPPDPDAVPTCASAGVLGPVAGMVGALQARLGISALEERRGGALYRVDGLKLEVRRVRLERRPDCPSCGEGARPVLADAEEVTCRR